MHVLGLVGYARRQWESLKLMTSLSFTHCGSLLGAHQSGPPANMPQGEDCKHQYDRKQT